MPLEHFSRVDGSGNWTPNLLHTRPEKIPLHHRPIHNWELLSADLVCGRSDQIKLDPPPTSPPGSLPRWTLKKSTKSAWVFRESAFKWQTWFNEEEVGHCPPGEKIYRGYNWRTLRWWKLAQFFLADPGIPHLMAHRIGSGADLADSESAWADFLEEWLADLIESDQIQMDLPGATDSVCRFKSP